MSHQIGKRLACGLGLWALLLNAAACRREEAPIDFSAAEPPVFEDVTVHDPSVMKADGRYYIIGSHLASASSSDLLKWEQISTSVSRQNPLIPNVFEELKDTFAWARSRTLWAGDWLYLEGTGRWHMYYCACEGSSPLSALGMASAEKPGGPYRDEGILLYSGGRLAADGTPYNPARHPNAIDPHVFYDKEGRLWMVYGSYSGGIFILKMDEKTGKPLPGQGYGKKLIGRNHSQIEAPYILYNKDFDRYYLFLSFGGLASDGGYQIRAAWSDRPDGPYVDGMGRDIIEAGGSMHQASRYMQKLVGNFSWPEASGRYAGGYVSPGHNTALYDETLDKYFLIFHTRFPGCGEEHQVRVHELFFTEDGRPLMAPFRYAGEGVQALQPLKASEIPGHYDYLNHGREVSRHIRACEDIILEKKRIRGPENASWALGENNRVYITAEGTDYEGFFLRQWDEARERYALCFSAVSADGRAIWGVKRD